MKTKETKQILLSGSLGAVEYELNRRSKSKGLRLSVYPDGRIRVSAPVRFPTVRISDFVSKKFNWIEDKLNYFKKFSGTVVLPTGRREYLKHKESAREFAHERLIYFNQFYNFTYHAIAIRDQKSRWGSCSKRGNLNFSYKIVRIDRELADYIIVHELCHLGQFNHSKEFWNLVTRTVPNHRELRGRLKVGKLLL